MLKKTITYRNLDGDELTEDFYFNLSLSEITRMELVEDGSLGEKLKRIVAQGKGREIIETFEWLLETAYGVRSENGKYFKKSPELFKEFQYSDAYSVLFLELVTNAGAASEFVKGIMPADIEEKARLMSEAQKSSLPEVTQAETSEEIKAPKDPKDMTREELLRAMLDKNNERK